MGDRFRVFKNNRGGAGKGFLIFLGATALLAVAGYALWKPILLPLVGEAVPQRVEKETVFDVPKQTPELAVTIPKEWVFQRGLFSPNTILVQTPDLKMSVEVTTWAHGSAPSFKAGLKEVIEQLEENGEEQTETQKNEKLRDGLVLFYTRFESSGSQKLVGLIGPETETGGDAKASALVGMTVKGAELDSYLPSFSEFLNGMEVQK